MKAISEIITRIEQHLNTAPPDPVNLLDALGKVIACDVIAHAAIPPCDICNVDGYAINSSDTASLPAMLVRTGKSKPTRVFRGAIDRGETVYVKAGCPLPTGSNAVIPEYLVDKQGTAIKIDEYVNEGQNILTKGIDVEKGDILITKGTVVTSRHVALASTAQIQWLPVSKVPKIGILVCTDDYISDPHSHEDLNKFSISYSLVMSLSAFIKARGGVAVNLGRAVDLTATAEQILNFKDNLNNIFSSVDMLVTIGGMHNIDDSVMWAMLEQKGAVLDKLDIAIGNMESIVVGNKDNTPIIGLPGSHVSLLICSALFMQPVMNKMLGIQSAYETRFAVLDRNLDELDKRADYLYARLIRKDNGDSFVMPYSAQDSLMLSVLAKTDCLIVVDKNRPLISGSVVEVIIFTGSIISV